MDFLRSFGAVILGFLLFISLSVFGTFLMLNSTVLNPDFIKKHVGSLDISAVIRDVAGDEIKDSLPPEIDFVEDSIYNVIDSQEAEIKKQAGLAVDSAYNYLLGRTDYLSVSISLVDLKSGLRENVWQEIDDKLAGWVFEYFRDDLETYIYGNLSAFRQLLPSELASYSDAQLRLYVDEFLDQAEAQVAVLGKAPVLSPILSSFARPYYDGYYDEFIAEVPDIWTADETSVPADVMDVLRLVRQYIGYLRIGFYVLIVFMLLLIGGIFLIYRNIQEPSRALGIDFTVFGLLELIVALVSWNILPSAYLMDIPQSVHDWLIVLYHDVIMVTVPFSIVVLVIGIGLIVVSFVVKKKETDI